MKPQTKAQAEKRVCPFTFGGRQPADMCSTTACMAWETVHEEIRREDHSGAGYVMNDHALKTGRHVRREGPQGSLGFLILDEVGVCARLRCDS